MEVPDDQWYVHTFWSAAFHCLLDIRINFTIRQLILEEKVKPNIGIA